MCVIESSFCVSLFVMLNSEQEAPERGQDRKWLNRAWLQRGYNAMPIDGASASQGYAHAAPRRRGGEEWLRREREWRLVCVGGMLSRVWSVVVSQLAFAGAEFEILTKREKKTQWNK